MKMTYIIIATLIIGGLVFYLTSCRNGNSENNNIEQKVTTDTSHVEVPSEFIDLLFADQTIAQINKVANANPVDSNSVWANFILASKLTTDKKSPEAIKILQKIADNKNNESRTILWSWNGLRELGVKPSKTEVLGLILEVPQQGSTEYLAMYSDKTARYLNYTGKIAVWETHEIKMDNLLQTVFIDSQNLLNKQTFQLGRNKATTDKVRFNFLTSNGIYQTEKTFDELTGQQSDIGNLFLASTEVLNEIVTKSTAK
jgi:hypothetical protein